MEQHIKNMVRECGVPAHIKGYVYLTEAITAAAKSGDAIDAEALYERIAANNDTTAIRVNRAIRHSIEVATYRNGENATVETNEAFIAHLAQKARKMTC